jgi:hypothetical protein
MTRTDPKALMEAIDRVHAKNMQSKEAARKFLIEAGIFLEDEIKPKSKSKTKKSK